MQKIIECVPNFSEGRNKQIIEKIVDCFRGKDGVKLLDYSSDTDHNRTVVTAVGRPDAIKNALLKAVKVALKTIDLTKHDGRHPKMGACDVAPLIPIKNMTDQEAIDLSIELGKQIGQLGIPVFLYEKSATAPHRQNLADVRSGQFEGLAEKMKDPLWTADFGPKDAPHPTFGAIAVGFRAPLIAFNVNLNTDNLEIANQIARRIRHKDGGLRFCKAIGIALESRKIVQVSMNLTDFSKTPIYSVVELIRAEARRYGVSVLESELIGLVPLQALVDTAGYYLQIDGFSANQVLEYKLTE